MGGLVGGEWAEPSAVLAAVVRLLAAAVVTVSTVREVNVRLVHGSILVDVVGHADVVSSVWAAVS